MLTFIVLVALSVTILFWLFGGDYIADRNRAALRVGVFLAFLITAWTGVYLAARLAVESVIR